MLTLYWNRLFLIKIFFTANSAHYCTTCLNHCSLFLVLPKLWCSGVHGAGAIFSLNPLAAHPISANEPQPTQILLKHPKVRILTDHYNFLKSIYLLDCFAKAYLNKDDGNLLFKQFISCTKTWNLVWSLMILINNA